MFNRTASALFLTMAFSGIFSNQITLAESVDIYFRGVVEPRASFGISTPGKMESSFSGKAGKGKNEFTNITPAKINVQTSNPITITVSSPDIVDTHSATLRVNSAQILGNNVTLPAGQTTVEVDMLSKQNQVFAPGTYNYDITVTIVSP
ncbi:hypothetical protein NIES267_18030 [Calothrix parasitica NIES-267]|uniref:Uncharacterized protein n=1 Tax=Calothrix parasitica NIES-267 TaxID=1973488 RepID=A0A1Z4LMC5_9CYAN|nr:hypothetical protein NIES267_18030 [Calothrix parasitica NIES-267]